MANNENLRPSEYKFTDDDRRKAAKKRQENVKRKRTIREAVETMLALDLTDKEIKQLADKGYAAENQLDALAAAALMGAKRGNSQMFSNLMKLLGEGVETVSIEIQDDSTKAMSEWLENERETFTTDSE